MEKTGIDQLKELLGGTEINEEIQEVTPQSARGDVMLASGYSLAEVNEAKAYVAEIIKLAEEVGKLTYQLMEKIDLFDRGKMHYRLGYESLSDWLMSEHYSFAGIVKYLKIYRYLTENLKIPRSMYETIDLAKAQGFLPLIKAEATRADFEIAFDISTSLSIEDWLSWTDEAAANLLADRPIDYSGPSDSVMNSPEAELEPGYYAIDVVAAKDIGLADPATNGNLKKLKRIRSIFFKDTTAGTIFLRVK